jgi:hypothetical protein
VQVSPFVELVRPCLSHPPSWSPQKHRACLRRAARKYATGHARSICRCDEKGRFEQLRRAQGRLIAR